RPGGRPARSAPRTTPVLREDVALYSACLSRRPRIGRQERLLDAITKMTRSGQPAAPGPDVSASRLGRRRDEPRAHDAQPRDAVVDGLVVRLLLDEVLAVGKANAQPVGDPVDGAVVILVDAEHRQDLAVGREPRAEDRAVDDVVDVRRLPEP